MLFELLRLLRESREPNFDILIEHPAPMEQPVIHLGRYPTDWIASHRRDRVQTPLA